MTEKNMWNLSPEEALKACQTSEQGLTTEQAEKIRLEAGENMLKEGKKKSPFQVFLDQFKDLMVVILIGAAIISMFSGNEESTIVIFAVLVMNAVLGTIQHVKAEKITGEFKTAVSTGGKSNKGWHKTGNTGQRCGAGRYPGIRSRRYGSCRWKDPS